MYLRTAQASSLLNGSICLHLHTSTIPTFITEAPPLYHLTKAVLNDCYSEVTAYTALAYSYWASFHDAYE